MSMSVSMMSMSVECDWVFWGSSSLLSSPHLFNCKRWGVVVVVGGCGGTDSGA